MFHGWNEAKPEEWVQLCINQMTSANPLALRWQALPPH